MYSISPIERCFIWLGGYSPQTLEIDQPQEREPVTKLGATVFFAMLVAGLNWAVGGWSYSTGLPLPQRYAALAVAACMGILLVGIFDRGFVYVIDTAGKVVRWQIMLFTAFRLAVVLAISSLTSQAVIPLLLGSELSITALKMQEQSEQSRIQTLDQQYRMDARESTLTDSQQAVARLTMASQTLPAEVVSHLASARKCWQDYAARRQELIKSRLDMFEARARLQTKASQCKSTENSAKAEQTAYFTRMHKQLAQAQEQQQAAESDLDTARSAVQERVNAAHQIEAQGINSRSSAVLWQLLRSNPGALGKWLLITCVLLICELLPLLYKLQMGQTPPGRRISAEKHLHQCKWQAHVTQQEHLFSLQEEISLASQYGVQSAMQNAEVRQVFAECFASTLKAMAPAEAVTSMMHDLKTRGPDVVAFQRSYPQFAQVIGAAWRNAIQQTIQSLMESREGVVA